MRYVFLAIALSFALVTVSHAVMYRWVDKDGVLHVTDDEVQGPGAYPEGKNLNIKKKNKKMKGKNEKHEGGETCPQ